MKLVDGKPTISLSDTQNNEFNKAVVAAAVAAANAKGEKYAAAKIVVSPKLTEDSTAPAHEAAAPAHEAAAPAHDAAAAPVEALIVQGTPDGSKVTEAHEAAAKNGDAKKAEEHAAPTDDAKKAEEHAAKNGDAKKAEEHATAAAQ